MIHLKFKFNWVSSIASGSARWEGAIPAFNQHSAGLCSPSQVGSSGKFPFPKLPKFPETQPHFPLFLLVPLPNPKEKLPRVLMVPSFLLLVLKINMHALAFLFMGVSSNHYKNMENSGNRSNKHGEITKLPKWLQRSLGVYSLLSWQQPSPTPPLFLTWF